MNPRPKLNLFVGRSYKMAKAKQRYMEIVEEFPIELHKPMLRLADAIMERIRTEFAVRREDFNELRSAIAELAQAQKRTEERVEELAQIQKRFEKHFDMQIGALGSRGYIQPSPVLF